MLGRTTAAGPGRAHSTSHCETCWRAGERRVPSTKYQALCLLLFYVLCQTLLFLCHFYFYVLLVISNGLYL